MALLAVPRVVPRDGLIATTRLPREVPRGVQLWTGSNVIYPHVIYPHVLYISSLE